MWSTLNSAISSTTQNTNLHHGGGHELGAMPARQHSLHNQQGAFGTRRPAYATAKSLRTELGQLTCKSLPAEARAVPDSPPEWTPPSDPGAPQAPPEFMPPGESGTTVRPPPEFTPPEETPQEQPRKGDPPLRPIRPEEEPKVPEPETPFADPIRTPERRERIMEPEEPESAPESE